MFLKHQVDIAIRNYNYHNYFYVPKLLTKTFRHLIELKNQGIVSYLEISKALNGFYDLSDEKYANISSIMQDINNNNWSSFEESEDYLIIAEILFIWLDECVRFCVNPKSVTEIFNNAPAFQNKSLTDCLINIRELSKDSIRDITNYIRNSFKKYEFEIVKYCALFFKEIFPDNDEANEIDEYDHMTEKIAIFLLGYNIDQLFQSEFGSVDGTTKNSQIFQIVQSFILILDFFEETSEYNLTQENQFVALKEEVRGHLNQSKQMDFDKSNTPLSVNSRRSVCVGGMVADNSKEQGLYDIYQMLKKHFDEKKGTPKSNTPLQVPLPQNDDNSSINVKSSFHNIKQNDELIEHLNDSDHNQNIELVDHIANLDDHIENQKSSIKDDWYSKKKKSQGGIFLLGKKRSTLKLKYRFSIRNKSGRNNSSSLNNQSKSSQDNVEKNYKSDDKGGSNVLVLNSNIYQPKTELMINSTNNKN